MVEDISSLITECNQIFGYFTIDNTDSAYALIDGDLSKTADHFDKLINGLFDKKIAEAKKNEKNEQSQREYKMLIGLMSAITLISIVLSTIWGRYNAKIISKPINSLVKSANAIAEGNLDAAIEKGNGRRNQPHLCRSL